MESYILGTHRLLGELFRHHSKYRRWHYAILLCHTNANSLANLIGLTLPQLKTLLTIIGLGHFVGKDTKFHLNIRGWKTFLIEQKLNNEKHQYYFDRFHVMYVPGGQLCAGESTASHRGYWIGIGDSVLMKDEMTNPSSQFQYFSTPPRITGKYKYTKEVLVAFKVILHEYENELEFDKAEKEHDNNIEIMNEEMTAQSNVIDAVMNLNLFLDDFKNGKRSKEDTALVIEASIHESIRNAEKERNSLITRMIMFANSSNDNHDQSCDMNDEVIDELVSSDEQKLKMAPCLTQFGIPLQPAILSVCVREIISLSNSFPSANILQYTNWKGEQKNVIPVSVCKNEKSFLRCNRRSKFIDTIPHSITRGTSANECDAAEWIMKRLATLHEDQFINVMNKMGYGIMNRKMDPDTAQAMWDEANVNTSQQRSILRYLKSTFG